MEPPAPGPGLGAGERARGEEAAETAEQRRQRPGERPPEKEEEEQAAAGPPGGERGEMESWQSLNVEVDDSHSLLASAAGLNTRREESDLSEFPSVEEGILTVSEEDGQDRAGEASCSPLLAIEDTSDSPCIPLLASSPTHKVWNETLFQQSELEFVPLRGIPDLSEISESHSRQSQINEALFPSSSEVPSDFCDSHPSSHPRKTVEISTIPSYDTSGVYSSFPLQQECIYTNKKSASSLDTCDELSRSHGTDSVETLASHLSLRTWGTSQKLETFPTRQDQSMLEDDRRLSHSCLLPCSEKKRLGFSSSADCSFCESFNYKNLEEYKGSPKLDCLKSDESKVERLGDMCSPLFKGALSSAFMSHSLFPMSSQGQSMQNSLGPDVNSVRFPVHSDSTRTGSSGVAFHSSFQHSDRFKLDDMPKPGPKRGVDANKTMAFHEIVASIEPTASKNNSAPIQNLLGVRSDWKQTISPLNSQIEKSSPEQLTQPVYQSTPSVFPIQNFTPAPSPRSIPVTSKLQPFVSPDEKLANPNPRNFTVWKPQSPSENRDISRRTIENRLPSSNTKGTSGDLPYVSPLAQTHSPTLVKSTHYDISCNFLCPGEASQLLASFKDSTLRTNAVMKDDTNIKNPQLSESGIISSERVAEMLREAKYNMKDLPEIWESLQNDIEPPRGLTGLTDEVRDGAAEHNIPPLTFSQTKSHKSTSNSDSEPASAEPSLTNAEVKEYQDRSSQTPPEKKAHHRHCFIDSHSFVPPIPCLPVLVREPQLPCPNTLEISYKSPKITSDVRSNFNSGISHVSWSIPVESCSHRDLPVPSGTSWHLESQEKTVSQVESTYQQQEEQASESTPEIFPKSEQAEEKSVPPAIPSTTSCYKENFKIVSERVQRLIDHWDSHLLEDRAHAVPLPTPTPVSVDKGGKKDKPPLSDIKRTPVSVDKDGKKGKPALSDIKETSESKSETDKRLYTLLVEAENIARKRVSNSPFLYPDVASPRLSRLDDSREAPLGKAPVGLSQRLTWNENVTPFTKVETSTVNHFTSQRDTGKTSVQEMKRKAREALKETLRQYETVQSMSRCEHGRSSACIGDEMSVPVMPFTSSSLSSDSSDVRVSYIWDAVSDSFFGYLPNIPAHVHMGDIREREVISDSDDGCSSDDSLAAHVQHLLTCDTPGNLATQMLRNAEEEECRVRARAWNLKFNLATDCGDVMTELDEADLRKVEEIKAHFFECGRPLDLFQDLPCPVRIKNISTLCDHVFIEAHEKDCFRTMPNEQFGGPSQDFRSSESPEMSERPSAAPWSTQCGRHAKSTLQTSQSKAWSFSRPGSHQPFPSSASESHYVNRGTPRSFHEEMETQLVGLVEPTTVSCQEPINLPSRPHSGFCSEALKCSRCFSDAPVVVQADQRESPPIVAQISATLRSKSPPPTSNRTLVNSLRKDPVLTGNQHDQVSFDLSAATKNFQEKEPPAPPTIQTTTEPQFNIKESQLSDNQDCARGLSPKSLEVSEKGVNIVAEFPSPVSPEEQAKCYQPRNVPPADNKVGPGYFSQTPLSQHKGSTAGEEDQLKQKMPSSNVADVEAESTITVHPDSPAPGGELSPTLSLSSSPKQRAISYLHITLSPKASNARLNGETLKKGQYALDSGARTRLNGSLNVNICASESTSLVPLEPAPQELAIIPLPDKKEFFNCTHHKTSQLSKSLSRQTQVNSSDLDAYSHSIGVRNTQGCGTSDHFRNADSATSLKLSSDVITQITTKGLEKATFSSEIIINSQAHNILNKPSHSPTAQLLLLPYKPSASVEMYYVPNSAEPPQYPVAKSETTLESTHSGSNDAIAPDFPPDALGTRDENMSDIVTIKHKEGIYSKKTVCEAAWTEEQNAPQENVSKSKNHLELENTTHSVFKSAQFYFHHPVHHHHDHDFFSCCEPWGRGAYLAHSRKDKDPCFNPLHETCEDEHRFSPLQTEMDYTRIERYCRNVGGNREPGAGQSLQENLNVGSKMSSVKETSKIRFSLAQTVEPSATLNELWNRFQERQKKQKPPISSSSDELSLVDRLDRLAKVLQKPTMLSLQASESAPDGCKGESMQQPRRKHQPKKKDENEYLSSHRSRWPPLSPFGLVSGDQVKLTGPRQPGLDSVSTISSDSRPSPEPADPVFESDVTAQTDGEAGPLGEVSSDMSIIDPAWIVQGRMHESPKRQQKHLSERQRGRKAANWKKTPSTSPEVRRKGMQVDSLVSSDSVSTVSSAWSPTPAPRKKQTVRMLNKGVQAGELEIVRNTRKHTRDFGVTFPTPNYNVTGKRVDNYMNSSSPGSNLEEKEPPTIYLWTKKPRRSKPHCSEGVSWFIPAENLRCASKKENQSSCMSGPGPSWFAPLTHTKPWRQPLREKNWQTDSRGAAQLQAMLPDLSDDKEARFVKAGLQESLERLRPDFISRSGARVKRLRLIIEERKLQRLLQRERDELFNTAEQQRESQDIAGFLSKKGYVTMRNRLITKREMVQRSKRIYEQLPEVRKRREEEQRKSAYSTYRYKAQLYKMKITNRVLGRKVPWD
ncbi:centrosome-associated protein ALMS1 isoform X3 [Notamacropus eugenii]|uniref:centrosome-associated protein ALMS1 isoform X3 n=1 Tax=Notamacropus eugenii TaxID=9315 RepID=UPI003B680D68